MAEGLAKKYLKPYSIKSAGTHPEPINLFALKVMEEINIDISDYESKSISKMEMEQVDIVVTLCGDARDQCVILDNSIKKHIHWNINDPAKSTGSKAERLIIFRDVRDLIEKKSINNY